MAGRMEARGKRESIDGLRPAGPPLCDPECGTPALRRGPVLLALAFDQNVTLQLLM